MLNIFHLNRLLTGSSVTRQDLTSTQSRPVWGWRWSCLKSLSFGSLRLGQRWVCVCMCKSACAFLSFNYTGKEDILFAILVTKERERD